MELKLTNPIVFFDLETTGINIAKDKIVEISVLKVMPNGKEEQKTIRVNPEMHIPEQASAIHGIYDDDVKNCPTFKEIAKDLARYIVDVQTIFHKMEQRTLSAAYRFYCNKNLEDAHTAAADTTATYEVLKAQLDRYNDTLENDIAFLSKFSTQNNTADFAGFIIYNEEGVEVFNFGKNKGVPVVKVLKEQPGYFAWMLNGEFPLYTKKILTEIRLRTAGLVK